MTQKAKQETEKAFLAWVERVRSIAREGDPYAIPSEEERKFAFRAVEELRLAWDRPGLSVVLTPADFLEGAQAYVRL